MFDKLFSLGNGWSVFWSARPEILLCSVGVLFVIGLFTSPLWYARTPFKSNSMRNIEASILAFAGSLVIGMFFFSALSPALLVSCIVVFSGAVVIKLGEKVFKAS
jgi:hypothetical protein